MAKPLLRAAVAKSLIVRVIVEMEPVIILCDGKVECKRPDRLVVSTHIVWLLTVDNKLPLFSSHQDLFSPPVSRSHWDRCLVITFCPRHIQKDSMQTCLVEP